MDAKVELIDFTGARTNDEAYYAARMLAFSKNTRLNMDPAGFQRFLDMPLEELKPELEYMVSTLPSSWEFVDATFCIRNVSRACAQQITRTRWSPMEADIFGSYAMQAQRVVDVSDAGYYVPDHLKDEPGEFPGQRTLYEHGLQDAVDNYKFIMKAGVSPEDARGLLPMHMHCNLIVKFDLRALAELCRKRESIRVQGEYVFVASEMRRLLCEKWPWVEQFFQPKQHIAADVIEKIAHQITDVSLQRQLAKAADLVKAL